jgi:ornithine cyclodeaminase/alanine dehydrogenase
MPSDNSFTILSDTELESMGIKPSEVADAIELALTAKAKGQLHTSPKTVIMPGDGRYMMSTLAVGEDGFIVVKQVSVCPSNTAKNLPTINGAIMVLDAKTGMLRAIVGANWITATRTAALSLVAARRMADPRSKKMAFVGTGVQAHAHLAAFSEEFPLQQVRILGRGQANIEKLRERVCEDGFEAIVCKNPEDVLRDADIVVSSITLDYTVTPFLDARMLKQNAFAAITDACIPWLPESMNSFRTLIVDDREQEANSVKPMLPYDQISGDLTDLVAGAIELEKDIGPSAFAFRGISLGDYAAATLAVRRAKDLGLGQTVSIG